jgi:hypothetical protein
LSAPWDIEELQNLLQRIGFVLEDDIQQNNDHERQIELINHTDRRYWIRSSSSKPITEESRHRLKEVFAE